MEYKQLADGNKIPVLGFGTLRVKDASGNVENVIYEAIKSGYRHIDTAESYNNEAEVGMAIKRAIDEGIVKREELFVTTKLSAHHYNTYEKTLKYFYESLKRLDLEYVDLYLIHWPNLFDGDKWKSYNAEIWKAMETLKDNGVVKSIGVSNFMSHHLEELLKTAKIKPEVNQLEISPQWQNKEAVECSLKHGLVVTAWGSLMRQGGGSNPLLFEIAHKYSKSIAQICIKWSLQKGYIPISKTSNPSRMIENQDVFDFEISAEDMTLLDTLQSNPCIGLCPDTIPPYWRFCEANANKEVDELVKYKLFDIVDIITVKRKSDDKYVYYLLGIIPFMSKKIISYKYDRLFLFGVIPLIKVKHRKKVIVKEILLPRQEEE